MEKNENKLISIQKEKQYLSYMLRDID